MVGVFLTVQQAGKVQDGDVAGNCSTKCNQLHLHNNPFSIKKILDKMCSQIFTFAKDEDLGLHMDVKCSPRKRKYSKAQNEERMTWVGIGRYARKKENIHRKKLEEPQNLRVGHELVGRWMWYTNDDVGGGGYMRDVYAQCGCKGINIWIRMTGWDCRLMNNDLKPRTESRIYTCVLSMRMWMLSVREDP